MTKFGPSNEASRSQVTTVHQAEHLVLGLPRPRIEAITFPSRALRIMQRTRYF